jgi:hypothetical protein
MTNYRNIEQQLSETLGLQRRPVTVTFRVSPPPGVTKFAGTEPSGCSFWRLAAGCAHPRRVRGNVGRRESGEGGRAVRSFGRPQLHVSKRPC